MNHKVGDHIFGDGYGDGSIPVGLRCENESSSSIAEYLGSGKWNLTEGGNAHQVVSGYLYFARVITYVPAEAPSEQEPQGVSR